MAVVIDRPFFESLVGLEREKHLSNAEIVWFITDYKETTTGWTMVPGEVIYTSLDTSVKALTGGTPLSREAFEAQLKSKLARVNPDHPLAL